jgi:hypothetical protein
VELCAPISTRTVHCQDSWPIARRFFVGPGILCGIVVVIIIIVGISIIIVVIIAAC